MACGAPQGAVDGGLFPDASVVDAGELGSNDGGAWLVLPSLPRAQQECGVAALNGHVYVVGGFGPQGALLSDVNRYDVDAGRWSAVRPLPRALHHVNVATLDGKLYALGNLEGGGFAARGDVFEYEPAADTWTVRAPLPAGTERGGSAMGVIGGEIIVAGGYRAGRAVTDVSAYAPSTNTHRVLPPFPVATEHVVGAAVGTQLFVIGGRDGAINSVTKRVFIYESSTNRWTSGPDLPTARAGHAAAVVGTRIVVVGGEGNSAVSSGVFAQTEVLETTSLTWSTGASMRSPRHGTGAATVGTLVIVPGGAGVEGLGPVAIVDAYSL